jgi:arginine decarboxylase
LKDEMKNPFMPTKMFLTKGVGRHPEQLTSFEMALRDAGLARYNLVSVSSIFPPKCKLVGKRAGLNELKPGQVVFTVLSRAATNEPHRLLAATIGVAIPKDRSNYGYLSEHHSFGQTEDAAGEYAEDLAAEMLATVLGADFDPAQSWDEKREIWRIQNEIVTTRNITQSAMGHKDGCWTSVIAAAVLVP